MLSYTNYIFIFKAQTSSGLSLARLSSLGLKHTSPNGSQLGTLEGLIEKTAPWQLDSGELLLL